MCSNGSVHTWRFEGQNGFPLASLPRASSQSEERWSVVMTTSTDIHVEYAPDVWQNLRKCKLTFIFYWYLGSIPLEVYRHEV